MMFWIFLTNTLSKLHEGKSMFPNWGQLMFLMLLVLVVFSPLPNIFCWTSYDMYVSTYNRSKSICVGMTYGCAFTHFLMQRYEFMPSSKGPWTKCWYLLYASLAQFRFFHAMCKQWPLLNACTRHVYARYICGSEMEGAGSMLCVALEVMSKFRVRGTST